MGLIYSVTVAVLVWIVLWAIGIKSFDALLFAAGIMVVATMVWKVLGYATSRSTESAGTDVDARR